MSTLPELHSRLELLNRAIHSGQRTVTGDDGASLTYRTLEEMYDVRRDLQAQIAAHQSPHQQPRAVVFRFSNQTLRGG